MKKGFVAVSAEALPSSMPLYPTLQLAKEAAEKIARDQKGRVYVLELATMCEPGETPITWTAIRGTTQDNPNESARVMVESAWSEGRISGRAKNALIRLMLDEEMTADQLRLLIQSGELRKCRGFGRRTIAEVKIAFL